MQLRQLIAAILVTLPALATAQGTGAPPPQHFVSTDRAPFGPGDRSLDLKVKLVPGDTTANVKVWVIYGENRAAVAAGAIGGNVPHAQARLGSVDSGGVVSARFIFPHSDHPTPNVADANPVRVRSGRTTHYKVVKVRGNARVESPITTFAMPDKLTIANFGDSFASGEGAPYYVPPIASPSDLWDDPLCHRNGNSGQARAVKTMKREHPDVAIAFVNVACSGAEIGEGLLQSQLKKTWALEPTSEQRPVPAQIDQVAAWLAEQGYAQLNLAMISGGGNDVRFGSFVEEYLVFLGRLDPGSQAARNLEQVIRSDVPGLYVALKAEMDRRFDYDRILVSEYPDPLRGANGAYCELDPVFSPRSEFQAFDESFLQPLNETIRTTVSGFPKWRYVGGTMAASRRNGLCNRAEAYFNAGVPESIAMQGDPFGTVHPTRLGHARTYQPAYEPELRNAITAVRRAAAIDAAKQSAREAALAKQQGAVRERRAALARPPTVMAAIPQLEAKRAQLLPAGKTLDAATLAKAQQQARALPPPPPMVPDNRLQTDRE